MARTSEGFLTPNVKLSLSLDRYQELMRLPIAAFNGLNNPLEVNEYQCSTIWKQSMRNYLAQFIAMAEEVREKELGFYLGPKCVEDELYDAKANPLILDRKHLIGLGKETFTVIQAASTLVLRDIGTGAIIDPVILVVATTVTDTSEIRIRYPGETEEIHPSKITIAGGNATIYIPRSRLVLPALNDDRELHLQYDDDTNFLTTVDVYRRYLDVTTALTYFYLDTAFAEQTHGAYGKIQNNRLSLVDTYPAVWSGSTPTYESMCWTMCGDVWRLKASYESGIRYTQQTEIETCRLTHTLMPYSPCDCSPVQQYWQNDRTPLQEGYTTPYGNTTGALEAWMHDSRTKIGFGGIL